jgi:hypothetical protein
VEAVCADSAAQRHLVWIEAVSHDVAALGLS